MHFEWCHKQRPEKWSFKDIWIHEDGVSVHETRKVLYNPFNSNSDGKWKAVQVAVVLVLLTLKKQEELL